MYRKHLFEQDPRGERESRWEPIPLQLPLHQPYWPQPEEKPEEEEQEERSSGGVLIIDMNDYSESDY
jgi:hypothetical protein